VQINGQDVAIDDWSEKQVKVKLARTGPTSAGEVVAFVRDHASNPRRITQWTLPMQYRFAMPSQAPLQVSGPVKLRLRADVGESRSAPGKAPTKPVRFAGPTRDTQAVLTASGSRADSDCTDSYSGAATLVAGGFDPATPIVSVFARLDSGLKQLALAILLGASPPLPWVYSEQCPSGTVSSAFAPVFGLVPGPYAEFDSPLEDGTAGVSMPAMLLTLGEDFSVQAGSSTETYPDLTIHFDWPAAPAQYPPDPAAAR
jgi:hypothetical protein